MYSIHPIAACWPDLPSAEKKALRESIRQIGQLNDIVLYEGQILDGAQRAKACEELGIEPRYKTLEIADPYAYVLAQNQHRRHLTTSQRGMIAAKMNRLQRGSNQYKKRVHTGCGSTRKELADSHKIATSTLDKAISTLEHGIPEVIDAVADGKISTETGMEIGKLPKEEQAKVLENAVLGKATGYTISNRRERTSKPAKKDKESRPTYSERVAKLPGAGEPMKFLTPEEFDPDFKGTSMEFSSKNGFVLLETKQEREKAKALSQMSFWIGELRKLRNPLLKFLEQCPIAQGQVDQWIEKFGLEKAEGRRAEVAELIGLLGQAAGCIKT